MPFLLNSVIGFSVRFRFSFGDGFGSISGL